MTGGEGVKKKQLYEIFSSQMQIVEMSSRAVNGRRRAKFVMHEIFPDDTQWNENGLSWQREYTEQNMHSIDGMSVTVEFADDKKREPFGHGYSGVNSKTGMPEFSNAVVVGHTHSPKIETLEVNGKKITALTAECSLDQHRYPLFIDWLFGEVNSGNTIKGSIEIVGANEGTQIQYESGKWTPTGRVPVSFAYSGFAILGIRAADPAAVVLELSSAKDENDSTMKLVKQKISKLSSNSKPQKRIVEINNTDKQEEPNIMDENKIRSMFNEMKANIIAELNSSNADDKKMADLCAENEKLTTRIKELEADLEKATSEKNEVIRERDKLGGEIKDLEKKQLVAELNNNLAPFTDEQKKVAKTEIDAFMNEPSQSEINSIVAKVKLAMAEKMMADAKAATEINSFDKNTMALGDIFGATDDTYTPAAGEGGFA